MLQLKCIIICTILELCNPFILFNECEMCGSASETYNREFYCFTAHFNSLNITHQLMHFQYNNILVYNVKFKTLKILRHVSILIDHHQGVRRCLLKVTEF